ncbi:MAG: hypothetical protein E7665_10080 [Ruminococcaceae bacterium]|nr:hypothetical protein [Oscillospiraceae bacterium]
MKDLFFNAVSLSIQASCFLAVVMILRVFLKKAPKYLICILWALASLRLIIPFSVESSLSLIPMELSKEYIYSEYFENETNFPKDIDGEFPDEVISPPASGVIVGDTEQIESKMIDPGFILSAVWICGIAIMLVYGLASTLSVKRRVRFSVKLKKGIKQGEDIASPFVFGIIRPVIYLPYGLSENDMKHVIAHEKAHIKRGDHLWKPFGFLLLSIYWFNPLMWISYILLCRDIEAACDEKVIKEMEEEERKAYSFALLNCSTHRRSIAACPLAFGETNVKTRIKDVMNYKKPAFWIIILAVLICVTVSICFLTDPERTDHIENNGTVISSGSKNTIKWFDRFIDGDNAIGEKGYETTLSEFPDKKIFCTFDKIWYEDARNGHVFDTGSAIMNVYFSDLNDDGFNEICVTSMYGSGIVDCRVSVFDLKNENSYTLVERGIYDYILTVKDNVLCVSKSKYPFGIAKEHEIKPLELIADGNGYKLNIDTFIPGTIPFYYKNDLNINDNVKAYAENIIMHHVEQGAGIIDGARICNIERINTGTSGLTDSVFLFKLTYELSAKENDGDSLKGAKVTADGWYSFDDRYFVMVYTSKNSLQSWFRAGTLTEDIIETQYDTQAMRRKYGSKYTAAAMETADDLLESIDSVSFDKYNDNMMYDGLIFSAWQFAEEKADKAGIVLDKESASVEEDEENKTVSVYFYEKDGGNGVIRVKYKRNSDKSYSSTDGFVMLLDDRDLKDESAEKAIAFLLDKMVKSAGNKNADEVIAEYKSEYNAITSFWDGRSLRYIFSEFLKGGQTGLRGEIMKRAMLDILKEDEIIKYASKNGQDYFDVWLKQAKSVASQHNKKWLEENTPNIALALAMAENNV